MSTSPAQERFSSEQEEKEDEAPSEQEEKEDEVPSEQEEEKAMDLTTPRQEENETSSEQEKEEMENTPQEEEDEAEDEEEKDLVVDEEEETDTDEEDEVDERLKEVCRCPFAHEVGAGTDGACSNCFRLKHKFLQAAMEAATVAISQHFTYMYEGKELKYTGSFIKQSSCQSCAKMTTPLHRRFGTTPKHFRRCVEDFVLRQMSEGAAYEPDVEKAADYATQCVHYWMENDVQMVTRRQRVRREVGGLTVSEDKERNWFAKLKAVP
jgi:hypothetical protein